MEKNKIDLKIELLGKYIEDMLFKAHKLDEDDPMELVITEVAEVLIKERQRLKTIKRRVELK